jgi:hypothetical protein
MIRWLRSLFAPKGRVIIIDMDVYLEEVRRLRHPSVQSYIDADIRPSIDEYRRDPNAWRNRRRTE